jgi:hypothetical protein
MRTGNATLRLEAHRLKWIREKKRIPLLPFHELTDNEKHFFIEELTKDVAVRRLNVELEADESMFDRMLLDILNEWGVMCPHPIKSVEKKKHGYYCFTCGCDVAIINFKKETRKTGK